MPLSIDEPVAVRSGISEAADATILDIVDLSISYPAPRGMFSAVEGFTLHVTAGERVAIVGESGSGKTNSCMAIAGFLDASAEVTAKRMLFNSTDLLGRQSSVLPVRIPGISVVFQDAMNSLDPVWRIGSQMISVIKSNERVSRRVARTTAEDWLRKVGLNDVDRVLASRPFELSGGMRQRVMIALALCAGPNLLIADEPTSALDATLSRELMRLMVSLAEELGTSMLIISHDISLCQEFTDRIVVMNGGRIVEEGQSRDIATTARHPYTRGLLSCIPTLDSALLHRLPTMKSPVSMDGAQ
ncbi:ABC transporter ATP-binding protein (plasmid) [Rhodococcus globerulus]|uniref:ABC transporter ATP-binding protein n=1 Tax=Rhodococcus globerulus TaxID=33008 RepID=UPI0039EC1AF4